MSPTTPSDRAAQPGILRSRKSLGEGLLLLAWACIAVVKPTIDDRGTAALLQYMQYQQASNSAALEWMHLRVIDNGKLLLQHVVPAEAVDLLTWDFLVRDYDHLREQLHRDLAVAAQQVELAGGREVAPGREDGQSAEERWKQKEQETQTIVAGMTWDFRHYHMLGRVAEAVGHLAFILGLLLLL